MILRGECEMEVGTPCLLYFSLYRELVFSIWVGFDYERGTVNVDRGISYSNYHRRDGRDVRVDYERRGDGFSIPSCIFELTEEEYLTKVLTEII